jgi:glycosyltransferase involved in cell wall biosynthesis
MTLKIGYLTERMVLGFGVDLVVHETAKRLAAKGHHVSVFATRVGDIYGSGDYSVVNLVEKLSISNDIFSPQFMIAALMYLSEQDIDAWIMETPPFYSWLPYIRPPVICIEHGTPPGKFFEPAFGRKLDRRTRERYNEIFRSLRPGDGLATISEYVRSCMHDDTRKNCRVIYNGADHYPRATIEQVREFRRELGIAPEQFLILWVGRIQLDYDWQPYKGMGELFEILPQVTRKLPQARILVVGRADEGADKILREKGLIPMLNLPKERMPVAFAAADAYLNTSKWEGFNLALVEAQFQGTPVIAYDLCAHPEVVTNGNSGLLVKSQKQLLEAIFQLAGDPEYRNQLAAGARKFSSRFTWDANAESLNRLIEGCSREAQKHPFQAADLPRPPKGLEYYKQVSRRIIKSEGMGVFLREAFGSLKRRLKRK